MQNARGVRTRIATACLAAGLVGGCAEADPVAPDATTDTADEGSDSSDGVTDRPERPDAGADATPAPPPCEGGANRTVDPSTGHCLVFFSAAATWSVADTNCKALGPSVHLATIASASENAVVGTLIGAVDAFLGANDLAQEMQWGWVTTEPMTFTRWRGGEPNNHDGNEDCMVIAGAQADTWDDRPCFQARAYVCERE
jgi:hypothetical protein